MDLPPLTLRTLTKGDVYQFLVWDVDPQDDLKPLNRYIWSGRFLEDAPGSTFDRKQFIRELARDSVGADALQGRTCEAVRRLVTKPEDLQTLLKGVPSPGCESSFERYASEQARLETLFTRTAK